MGVWYRFPLRWGSKFYFPSNPFCQTLSHHSSIQYSVYFLLHFTFEMLYFNAHHGLRSHCWTNLPVASFYPSSILTIPLLHPALNTVFFLFLFFVSWHEYIHISIQQVNLLWPSSLRGVLRCSLRPCKLSQREVKLLEECGFNPAWLTSVALSYSSPSYRHLINPLPLSVPFLIQTQVLPLPK